MDKPALAELRQQIERVIIRVVFQVQDFIRIVGDPFEDVSRPGVISSFWATACSNASRGNLFVFVRKGL